MIIGLPHGEAAAKFVLENQHKPSLHDNVAQLKMHMPGVEKTMINQIHRGTLNP